MATIGLYDIDFLHGGTFSLSVPLMKAYNRLYTEGHNVIMMKKNENTGRFNKICYFKESPELILPSSIHVDRNRSQFFGYGFLKESGLSEETKQYAPVFTPYELYSQNIKNKDLFNSIKINSIVDWLEKDFTGYRKGTTMTYVNDRELMKQSDWEGVFTEFDNNIEFVKPIRPQSFEQAIDFLNLYTGHKAILLPAKYYGEQYLELINKGAISFTYKTEEELFLYSFAAKIISEKHPNFYKIPLTEFERDLQKWNAAGRISFKEWKGNDFDTSKYLSFKYRILLKQNPKKMNYEDFKANYLT